MSRSPDLTGMRFGRWTVLRRTENASNGSSQWLCNCSCGTERTVQGKRLVNGLTVSCGCFHADITSIIKTSDLVSGQRFGAWEILEFDAIKNGKAYWRCKCQCGVERSVNGSNLRSGRSRSCGKCEGFF